MCVSSTPSWVTVSMGHWHHFIVYLHLYNWKTPVQLSIICSSLEELEEQAADKLTMFNCSLVFFLLVVFSLCHHFIQSTVHRGLGHADDRKNLTLDNNVWDLEYSKGDWSYLATNPLERSRLGIIYSSFYQTMANKNHLLDVGCGEGALSDLFLGPNAHHYHGIDVSKVAIEKAKIKRPHFDFSHANAMDYKPSGPVTKFKMIVFSEMIYYIDHKTVLPHYANNYLEPNGTFVVSGDFTTSLPTNQPYIHPFRIELYDRTLCYPVYVTTSYWPLLYLSYMAWPIVVSISMGWIGSGHRQIRHLHRSLQSFRQARVSFCQWYDVESGE